jgi:hypothetical protein
VGVVVGFWLELLAGFELRSKGRRFAGQRWSWRPDDGEQSRAHRKADESSVHLHHRHTNDQPMEFFDLNQELKLI